MTKKVIMEVAETATTIDLLMPGFEGTMLS